MPATPWKEFVENAMCERSPIGISIQYENMESVPISALTVANRKIIEVLIDQGETAIAIGVCDYSREALAFTLGMAIDDAFRGNNQIEYDTSKWKSGDIVSLCGFNFEFREFTEDGPLGPSIVYTDQQSNSRTSRGLSYIPGRIQKCSEGSKATSKRKGRFQDGVDAYKALSNNAKILHDTLSLVNKPVILSTSQSDFLNVAPTKLKNARVYIGSEELSLQKCIKIGHIGTDGELNEICEFDFEGNPSVISVCRDEAGVGDLYYALEYIENGGKPWAVVIEAPEPETIDGMFSHIEDISAHGVPVIVFCDERTLRKADSFKQLNFLKINWTQEALKSLRELSEPHGYQLTHREMCAANRVFIIKPVIDAGDFPVIAKIFYGINSNRMTMSEKGQRALSTLNRLLSIALKQTEVVLEDVARIWSNQIREATAILCNSAFDSSLSMDEVKMLREASRLLEKALTANNAMPKEDFAYHLLKYSLTRGRKVCLVTSSSISAHESSEYWKDVFLEEDVDLTLIRALTPREFLKQECTPDDEDVFISGWFSREIMDKLINSGLSSIYSILLYQGDETELETNWYLSASDFWKKQRNGLIAGTKIAFKQAGICDFESIFPEPIIGNTANNKAKEDDTSISKIVETMDDERASYERACDGEDSHLARSVYFTDGRHKWLRVPDISTQPGGDTLIVIVGLRTGKPEFVRRSASALHDGDLVLRMDTDDDALEDLCRQNFGSYEETLRVAQSWRKPIDEARKVMSDLAIKEKIIRAGSRKTDQTILSWIRGDIVIAPNNKRDIAAISRAFENAFTDEDIEKIARAVRIVKGNRINSGKSMSGSIAKSFVNDVAMYGLEEAINGFDQRHGLGTVELLCVDHVGKAQMVSVSRFGYYIE